MGNIVNNNQDGLPKNYSYEHTKDIITELNTLCMQNARELGFKLVFKGSELQYNHKDWKKSIIFGVLSIQKGKQTLTYNLIVSLKNIHKMHETMKHFQKRLSQSKTMATYSGIDFSTPGYHEECCICMDKTPSMMLPCYHSYCAKCTQIHIIQKQQKKCPICRADFTDANVSLEKQIIQIIGDEEALINDLREILFDYLKETNSHQIGDVEKIIKIKKQGPMKND